MVFTTQVFEALGLNRNSLTLFYTKWVAFILAIAPMGMDVTKYGIPARAVPYIQLLALFISVSSAQHRTSDLPAADPIDTMGLGKVDVTSSSCSVHSRSNSGIGNGVMTTLIAAIGLTLATFSSAGCATVTAANKAPAGLSTASVQAWYGTRAIQALDVVRDAAVSANQTQPMPLLSTATTRRIVQFHESAISVIHTAPSGWKPLVSASLGELLKNVSPPERKLLTPYFALLQAILSEVN